MHEPRFQLAQANIARMRAPIEHPSMESFRVQLESINRLADQSPGFVWRLQTDAGDATGIQNTVAAGWTRRVRTGIRVRPR